ANFHTAGTDAAAHQQQTCGNRRACPGRHDLDAETAHSKGLLGGRRIFVAGQVAGLYLECVRAGSQAAEWALGAGVEGRVGTAGATAVLTVGGRRERGGQWRRAEGGRDRLPYPG